MKRYRASQFARYLLKAQTAHGIHSPFVYDFVTQIIYAEKQYYAYEELEKWRNAVLSDPRSLQIRDFGASSVHEPVTEQVGERAKRIGLPLKYLKLLYKMVTRYNRKHILELGTGFGITAGYLSKAASSAHITTVEGCPQTADVARENLTKIGADNVALRCSEFDAALKEIEAAKSRFDMIFIDGNHREKATLDYFERLIPYSAPDAIFIFDDIYWSPGMTRAWDRVKENPNVRVTVDLYRLGVVFMNPDLSKQHFRILY